MQDVLFSLLVVVLGLTILASLRKDPSPLMAALGGVFTVVGVMGLYESL